MQNKGNMAKLLFWFFGIALGGVLLYLLYSQSAPMAILHLGFFISYFLSVGMLYGIKKRFVIVFLIVSLVFSIVLVSMRLTDFQIVLWFSAILSVVLLAPFLLMILVCRMPMKSLYKKAVYASFVPILLLMVFGRWGNDIQSTAVVSLSIPLFFFLTKDSDAKERWICYGIFVGVLLLFSLVFGSVEYIFFQIVAFATGLLVVVLLSRILPQSRRNWLILVLVLVSVFVSYFGSLNSFYYFVSKEDGNQLETLSPLSYRLVVNECDTLNEESAQGNTVVIYFWSSHCANCHREFPSFSDLAAEYKSDTTKLFVAAFVSFEEEGDSAFYQMETEQRFDFIWAKVHHGQQLMKELGFNAFPHLTILNKKGQIVYNGMYINRKGVFVHNPRKYVDL